VVQIAKRFDTIAIMTLTPERLQLALAPRLVRFFQEIESTNDVALDWLREGAPAGSVVIADEQLKGRGRLGRTWHTPPGVALAVSVILRPHTDELSRVSLLGALAIAELCEQLGLEKIGIKWPNDVQIDGRKVSGVLPEAVWDGSQLLGVVLGLGINVRTNFTGTELEQTAISLEAALGRPIDRVDLLVYLLDHLEYWAARLRSDRLFTTWKNRLTTLGQIITVTGTGGPVHGIAQGVDPQGALLVQTPDGIVHSVIAGDIAMGM
jgi:BirA family transcriptional regulator, biotin operon repressor / biotin---[acetyl-CoA-carboxylase] ligase